MIKLIAIKIAELYELHDYVITPKKLKILAGIIHKMSPTATEKQINEFFNFVMQGQYGILYKSPTCLTSMYYTYRKDNWKPPKNREDYGVFNKLGAPMPESLRQRMSNIGKPTEEKK